LEGGPGNFGEGEKGKREKGEKGKEPGTAIFFLTFSPFHLLPPDTIARY
jgi:hypothetical protein